MVSNGFTDIKDLNTLDIGELKWWGKLCQDIAKANEKYLKDKNKGK